jgi:hypothetical protein
MTYRDDLEAAQARSDSLERELADAKAELAEAQRAANLAEEKLASRRREERKKEAPDYGMVVIGFVCGAAVVGIVWVAVATASREAKHEEPPKQAALPTIVAEPDAAPKPKPTPYATHNYEVHPCYLDVTGDGEPDVIGQVRWYADDGTEPTHALAALDGATGKLLWHSDVPPGWLSCFTPATVVVAPKAFEVRVIDARTGKTTLTQKLPDVAESIEAKTPGRLDVLAHDGSRTTIAVPWEARIGDDDVDTVKLGDGVLTRTTKAAGTPIVTLTYARAGDKIWSRTLDGTIERTNHFAASAEANAAIIAYDPIDQSAGESHCVEMLSLTDGKSIAHECTNWQPVASVAVGRQRVFVVFGFPEDRRNPSPLFVYDATTGKPVWYPHE